MALISRRPTSAVRSIKALKILRQMWRCFSHDRSDCSTLSSFVESSSSSYLHLHELVALSSFGASGPEVVLKYIALGFPSFRQQQSLRTSYSQVSAKTNEVKRMEHLITTQPQHHFQRSTLNHRVNFSKWSFLTRFTRRVGTRFCGGSDMQTSHSLAHRSS